MKGIYELIKGAKEKVMALGTEISHDISCVRYGRRLGDSFEKILNKLKKPYDFVRFENGETMVIDSRTPEGNGLAFEMIEASREFKKNYIHLGLGVNKGIRRFKKKWGGTPTHSYEMCELVLRKPSIHDAVLGIRQMLRNT